MFEKDSTPDIWTLQTRRRCANGVLLEVKGLAESCDQFTTDKSAGYDGSMSDVTQILNRIEQGDPAAASKLLPLVYDELRILARQRLSLEKPGQTLQATALVHEAYMRLLGSGNRDSNWDNRGHFFAAAAEAMRRIVIDMARSKNTVKAGGNVQRISLSYADLSVGDQSYELLDLDEALSQLESDHPRKATLVKMRFFAGLTNREAAEALGVSIATVENDWAFARSYLRLRLQTSD